MLPPPRHAKPTCPGVRPARAGLALRGSIGWSLPALLALAACGSNNSTPPDAHDAASDCGNCLGARDSGTDTGTDAGPGTDAISDPDAGDRDAGPSDAGTDAMDTGVDCGACLTDSGTDATAPDVAPQPDVMQQPDVAPQPDVTPIDDTPSSTDAGMSIEPVLDAPTTANVRAILATGATMGNRPNVFAKIGDSISESGSFLQDIGHGWYDLGSYTSLMGTITYFSSVTLGGTDNSFDRASLSAVGGWTSGDALTGGDSSAFVRELQAIHPGWAVIMYGTNDVDHWGADMLTANLTTMITRASAMGVVPILSTIPDRQDGDDKEALVITFNAAIRTLAHNQHVPIMDYWLAMQTLPDKGISSDGIHPNAYTGSDGMIDTEVFTTAGLQYGYNMRNLVVVRALDVMRTTFE